MEQGPGHGEVLALTQGAGGSEQAGDGAGEVAEQAVLLAEAGHHVIQGADAHLLQGGVQEHGAVETRRVVAHLGDDVGVAQHHQGGVGLGAGGEAAGVAGALGTTGLEGDVAQGIGHEQGLVGGRLVGLGDATAVGDHRRVGGVAIKIGPGFAKILHALAEGGGFLGQACWSGCCGIGVGGAHDGLQKFGGDDCFGVG